MRRQREARSTQYDAIKTRREEGDLNNQTKTINDVHSTMRGELPTQQHLAERVEEHSHNEDTHGRLIYMDKIRNIYEKKSGGQALNRLAKSGGTPHPDSEKKSGALNNPINTQTPSKTKNSEGQGCHTIAKPKQKSCSVHKRRANTQTKKAAATRE